MREFMFKQLGQIISIIKQHARDYMPDILAVVRVSASSSFVFTCICGRAIYYFCSKLCFRRLLLLYTVYSSLIWQLSHKTVWDNCNFNKS